MNELTDSFSVERHGATLTEYFGGACSVAYAIAPFISTSAAAAALGRVGDTPTIVMTSWRKDHLMSGASTLDLYELSQERGWTLYILDDLHAKIYSLDLASAWLGSANMTRRGLGTGGPSNFEILTKVELSSEVRVWVFRMLADAVLVDDAVHAHFQSQLEAWRSSGRTGDPTWLPAPRPDQWRLNQLPASASPHRLWEVLNDPGEADSSWNEFAAAEHDIALFRIPSPASEEELVRHLRAVVFDHPFISALAKRIPREGIRFGGMKEWVQRTCSDVPVPFRRELTSHVQALYAWLEQLAPECFEIRTPGRRSQVIYRRDAPLPDPGA